MERLTKYSNDIIRNKAVNILRKLDSENGLDGDKLAIISSFCLIERMENKELKKYEDLEEQGKLLKLPCDTVWFICDKKTNYATVMPKSISNLAIFEIEGIDKKGYYWSTEDKALAALKNCRKIISDTV